MWFIKCLFLLVSLFGTIIGFYFLLRHYGSAVKVYLIVSNRAPTSSVRRDPQKWAEDHRQKLKDLANLPLEIKKEQ